MAKKMPNAGRPAKTPGGKVPPRKPGVTGGKVRSRTGADTPRNPAGHATPPKRPGKKPRRG